MNYLVVWSDTAFDQMGFAILQLPDRRAGLAKALKEMMSGLRTAPLDQGESRDGNDRIWFVDDLVVSYAVDTDTATVTIGYILIRP
jgi:hypothetical protein